MIIQCKYDQLVPLHKIIPNPKNPNKHSPESTTWLAKNIDYQGIRHPIIMSKRSGFIAAGHGRLYAATELGLEDFPVVFQDFDSEAQEYEFLVADNKLAEFSETDESMVIEAIKEIPDLQVAMLAMPDMLDQLADTSAESDPKDDQVPEVDDNPYAVKRGDVWELGNHRVMCGDSMDKGEVDKLMNGVKVDMVFTDPPYGYNYKSSHQSKHKMLINDDKILDFLPMCNEVMENNSAIYLCTSHQVIDKWKPPLMEKFKYKNMIVWKKNNWSMGDLRGAYAGQYELILFAHKGTVALEGKRDTDIWEFKRTPPKLHPTQKTIELIVYAITKVNCNRVLDLFLGSGSTLIACEKTDRKCYGMEIDPHYCSVIIKRWEEFTGNTARRITL